MNHDTSARGFIATPAAAVSSIIWPTKQPCRTSILTGDARVKELLARAGETINYRFLKLLVALWLLACGIVGKSGVKTPPRRNCHITWNRHIFVMILILNEEFCEKLLTCRVTTATVPNKARMPRENKRF